MFNNHLRVLNEQVIMNFVVVFALLFIITCSHSTGAIECLLFEEYENVTAPLIGVRTTFTDNGGSGALEFPGVSLKQ